MTEAGGWGVTPWLEDGLPGTGEEGSDRKENGSTGQKALSQDMHAQAWASWFPWTVTTTGRDREKIWKMRFDDIKKMLLRD